VTITGTAPGAGARPGAGTHWQARPGGVLHVRVTVGAGLADGPGPRRGAVAHWQRLLPRAAAAARPEPAEPPVTVTVTLATIQATKP
jgi:hypothetical protein